MKLYSIKPGFKKARTAAHLTQQQFADQFLEKYQHHVSLKTVMNWEQGLVTPPLETICRIADLLHCDIDFLTGRIECSTHDVQFIHDRTGLSESAIKKLNTLKDTQPYAAGILSQIIDHRLFSVMIRSFKRLITPIQPIQFINAVVDHLANDAPYTDSPDDLKARDQFEVYRTLSNIADDLRP